MSGLVDEVYVLLNDRCRISRNTRAKWYLDHLHKEVKVTLDGQPKSDDETLSVVGIVQSEDGGQNQEGNGPVVVGSTAVRFLSGRYRFVFILDLSPSSTRFEK